MEDFVMQKRKKFYILALASVFFLLAGCGKSSNDFRTFGRDTEGKVMKYRYLSADTVEIMVAGVVYPLTMDGPRVRTPFGYEFEDDGDIDIRVGGKIYDIDSPYDYDPVKIKLKMTGGAIGTVKSTRKKSSTKKTGTVKKSSTTKSKSKKKQ